MYYRRNIIVRLQTPSERENSFRSETERTRSPNRVVILAHCITSRKQKSEKEKKQSATGETETVPFLLRSCEVVKLLPFLPIFISIWLYIFPCVCFYIFANRLAIHFACNVVHSILGLSVCFGARRQNHTKQRWRSYARELFVCLLFLHSAA